MDNFLVRIAPELNQSLLQFVNAMDVSLVNMLLQGRLCLTVKS